MFWARREKDRWANDQGWALSYGDLMSLLLAIFVMIAAMSDLKAGRKFDRISGAVRSAFGFTADEQIGTETSASSPALLARLEREGMAQLARLGQGGVGQFEGATLLTRGSALILRLDARYCFQAEQELLSLKGKQWIAKVGRILAPGGARIEIRVATVPINPGKKVDSRLLPANWDLSYQRARSIADVLGKVGVDGQRMQITVLGPSNRSTLSDIGQRLDAKGQESASADAGNPGQVIELVVHAEQAR